jgi:hypothetical protein
MPNILTLQDLADVLAAKAAAGTPCPTDWQHRAVDVRIAAKVFDGLGHAVEAFDDLLPDAWNAVPTRVRSRIPGSPTVNHKRLRGYFSKAIAYHRPNLNAWSTLAVLAELDCGHHARAANAGHAIRWLRSMASDGGLICPNDVTTVWIMSLLSDVPREKEAQTRAYARTFVRLAANPIARRRDLVRADLAMPPTKAQAAAMV